MKIISYVSFFLLLSDIFGATKALCQVHATTFKKAYVPGSKIPQGNVATLTTDNTKTYVNAIGEYIKAVYVNGIVRPDTLFIGKNVDMPNIKLPHTIEGITTVLITSEAAQNKLSYRKSLVYLNVVGWPERDKSEFIIVRFNEFKPQHNCTIHFKRNAVTKQMELESLKFDYPNGQQTK